MKVYKAGHRWGRWTLTPRRSLTHDGSPDQEFAVGSEFALRSVLWLVRRVAQAPHVALGDIVSFTEALMDLAEVAPRRTVVSMGRAETAASQERFKQQAHLRRLPGRVG